MMFLILSPAFICLISFCHGIEYLIDATGGHSCDQVCAKQKKICAATGHGFSQVTAEPVLRSMGIDCGPDNDKARYTSPDNPSYDSTSPEICIGYESIPDRINCTARGVGAAKRICPCVHGAFVRFQFIETLLGSTNVVSFVIDGEQYLAFNRLRAYGRYQSDTQIFRLHDNSFTFHQTLKSTYNGPGRAGYFQIGSYHYIAIPYFARSSLGKHSSKTVIFSRFGLYFDVLQELDGGMALATTFVEIHSFKLLVIQGYQLLTVYTWMIYRFVNLQMIPIEKRAYVTECCQFTPESGEYYLACSVWGGKKKSIVLKWNGKKFVIHQKIHGIEYAMSAQTISLNNKTALLIAQRQNGYGAKMIVVTPLLIWDKRLSQFIIDKSLSITTRGASACRPFKISNDLYVAVSQSADKKSLIYKYQDGQFVVYQELRAVFADDAAFFTHNRVHYLILATQNMRYSPAFVWN